MNRIHSVSITLAALVLATSAAAAPQEQHQAHHPDAASAPSAAPMTKPGTNPSAMQSQMKAMQAMHDKIMAAKTAEERSALMAEHMKVMQDGMAMMQGMKADAAKGAPATRQRLMEMRMDMMQSMMQMMMDGMPAAPSK